MDNHVVFAACMFAPDVRVVVANWGITVSAVLAVSQHPLYACTQHLLLSHAVHFVLASCTLWRRGCQVEKRSDNTQHSTVFTLHYVHATG